MTVDALAEEIASLECSTSAALAAMYGEADERGDDLRDNALDSLFARAEQEGLTEADIWLAINLADRIYSSPRGDRRRAETWPTRI